MKRKILLFITCSLLVSLLGCGNEIKIKPNIDESKLIINEMLSTITIYALLENTGRREIGPLHAKFITYDETLQEALGAETIYFSTTEGKKQSFSVNGNQAYFISESFIYNAELDADELMNMVEVVIEDRNGMELIQFLIPNIEKIEHRQS